MYRILWITENGLPTLLVRFIPSIFYLLKPRFYLRASECQNIFPLPCLLWFLFQYFCNYNRYCRKGSKGIIHHPCCLKASFRQTPQFDTPDKHVRTPRRASNSDSIISQEAPKTKKGQWAHEKEEKVQSQFRRMPWLQLVVKSFQDLSQVSGCL